MAQLELVPYSTERDLCAGGAWLVWCMCMWVGMVANKTLYKTRILNEYSTRCYQ